MRTLIHGGTIVNSGSSIVADVLIEGERIAAIGEDLSGDIVLDAVGKYVIPGGIDVHTHLDNPTGTTVSSDDFFTGQRAAAFGGTTSHIDFAKQRKGHTLKAALSEWHARAEHKAVIDYGFHIVITDLSDAILEEIAACEEYGVTSIKLFLAYKGKLQVDDSILFRVLQQAARYNLLVMVHAENGDVIDTLVRQALQAGHVEPKYHALTRPPQLETEATHRAILLAEVAGAPIYIVHITNAGALEEVRAARARDSKVYGETCTHYLFFTQADLARPGFEGAKWVCSPPLREVHDQARLWQGLYDNTLQVISTDHCPFWFEGGKGGRPPGKELGRHNFAAIPNGCPGIEDRLSLIFHHGVLGGRLSLERWVEICCTNPAKLFGMYPQKGIIAPGSDADIVIWNPSASRIPSASTHHQQVDYNLYEGMKLIGRPSIVMSRGRILVQDDAWHGHQGTGRFVKRKPWSPEES